MEDFLARCLAVREEEIHPVAPEIRPAQRRRQPHRGGKEMGAFRRIEILETRGVSFRDDQRVPFGDRSQIEKGDTGVVLVDNACRGAFGDDLAEDAGSGVRLGGH